jgi:hypothetical protein
MNPRIQPLVAAVGWYYFDLEGVPKLKGTKSLSCPLIFYEMIKMRGDSTHI